VSLIARTYRNNRNCDELCDIYKAVLDASKVISLRVSAEKAKYIDILPPECRTMTEVMLTHVRCKDDHK